MSIRSPRFHEIHEVHGAAYKFSYVLTLQITSMDIFHLQCCWSPSPPCSSVSTWPPWSGPRKKLNLLQCFPKVTMMLIAQEHDYCDDDGGLDSNEWSRKKSSILTWFPSILKPPILSWGQCVFCLTWWHSSFPWIGVMETALKENSQSYWIGLYSRVVEVARRTFAKKFELNLKF